MRLASKSLAGVRNIGPLLFVAVAVVLAGTVTGAYFDHVHKVAADEVSIAAVQAVASGNVQTLTIGQWGVQVAVPFAAEMPLLSYANESAQSVGLSSADLEKLGPQCGASKNALGALTRNAAGSYGSTVKADAGSNLVATIGEYEYVYKFPQGSCSDTEAGRIIINREESVLLEALSTLAPAK